MDTTGPSSVPIPLLVLGGMSIALLAAGGLGYLSRRRQAATTTSRTTTTSRLAAISCDPFQAGRRGYTSHAVSSDSSAAVARDARRLVLALGLARPAAAAPSCGARVLQDWSDNGRVDRVYASPATRRRSTRCRPTSATTRTPADVIERALYTAVREGAHGRPTRSAESSSPSRRCSSPRSPWPRWRSAAAPRSASSARRRPRRGDSAGKIRGWKGSFQGNLPATAPSGPPPTLPGPLARCSSLRRAEERNVRLGSGGDDGNAGAGTPGDRRRRRGREHGRATRRRASPRAASSRSPAATRSTRSSGSSATRSSRARTAPRSSRRTSSSRSSGRRPRRTSSRRSTSAAAWPRPSASAR